MSEKRTKADKAQRQADQLEKRAPSSTEEEGVREDFSQANTQIVRGATKDLSSRPRQQKQQECASVGTSSLKRTP